MTSMLVHSVSLEKPSNNAKKKKAPTDKAGAFLLEDDPTGMTYRPICYGYIARQ